MSLKKDIFIIHVSILLYNLQFLSFPLFSTYLYLSYLSTSLPFVFSHTFCIFPFYPVSLSLSLSQFQFCCSVCNESNPKSRMMSAEFRKHKSHGGHYSLWSNDASSSCLLLIFCIYTVEKGKHTLIINITAQDVPERVIRRISYLVHCFY